MQNPTLSDDDYCLLLIKIFQRVFPHLAIKGGASEPFYQAPKSGLAGVLYFRDNYPRSLLHEMAHYCLAGERRRGIDDFGYWYAPCGRTSAEQARFEQAEARPQGLEKAFCAVVGLQFSPSLDDFSGRPASQDFLDQLDIHYREMRHNAPPTALKALEGLARAVK